MSDTPTPPPTEKKKRTLPTALAKFKFQKGHKRAVKPATPATSSQTTVTAANAGAVTVKRHDSVLSWLGL